MIIHDRKYDNFDPKLFFVFIIFIGYDDDDDDQHHHRHHSQH